MPVLTEPQIKLVVKEAVRETFLQLGLDVSGTDDIVAIQKDMHHLRTQRLRSEAVGLKARLAIVGMIVPAILASIWLAITQGRTHGG